MRQSFPRPLALVVCALALCLASCSSNNKGKIVGKWKATTAADLPAGAPADMFNMILEFTADGRAIMTMSMLGKTETLMTAKYSLGTGDWITLSDISPTPKDGKTRSKDKVKIDGDTMTIEGESKGKTMTFTRVKEGGPASAPAPK